jgi:hypothetical protein
MLTELQSILSTHDPPKFSDTHHCQDPSKQRDGNTYNTQLWLNRGWELCLNHQCYHGHFEHNSPNNHKNIVHVTRQLV